jgi:hypothetical protein
MRALTPAGQRAIDDLAKRHGFSSEAVLSMLESVINGNCTMAQFSHPEFGGSGQWMRGGMVMVSDMFNNSLKGRVDGLCNELAGLVASQPDLIRSGSFQSQSQGAQSQGTQHHGDFGSQQQQTGLGPVGPVSLFVPAAAGSSGNWWPADLGWPSSTGGQNNVRYAYFGPLRRVAIEVNGRVTLYDTRDHQITGFSQQQSHGGSLTFSSQHGLVDLASLPIVSEDGAPAPTAAAAAPPSPSRQSTGAQEPTGAQAGVRETDIFTTIEKLADLHRKGILGDEEFAAKKAELLSRL